MTPEEYLHDRVDDQISWLDRKSGSNQRLHVRFSLAQIAAASAVPVISGLRLAWSPTTVGILGGLIALIGGVLSLMRFQAKWIEYRSTCEALKRERYFYLANVDVYGGPDAFTQFVARCEALLNKENATWAQNMVAPPPASKG